MPGVYSLIDICGEHERELIHANMEEAGKAMFKRIFEDYTKFHKFTGKV